MTKLNIVVLPYRDRYFVEQYGAAVRDLHIMQALALNASTDSITAFNRPVSIHERLLGYKAKAIATRPSDWLPNVAWMDTTSIDLVGPLFKRTWLRKCYSSIESRISAQKRKGHFNVLLDFTPLSLINYERLGFDSIWYDLIDNFTKHNRFSDRQRAIVGEKYSSVASRADLITGVSAGALAAVPGDSQPRLVLPNGLPALEVADESVGNVNVFDFGFMGFVTDKFDVDFVARLCRSGYTVAVHGEIYDPEVGKRLGAIPGVKLFGAFSATDAAAKAASFRVGLIPYIESKRHDESPLKLYQYLRFGRPVLTSSEFELDNPYVFVYTKFDQDSIDDLLQKVIMISRDSETRDSVRDSVDESVRWTTKIEAPILALQEHFNKNIRQ